ncbi:MAG: hypothetical protein WCB76_15100, partial [Acidobacteriaceae bacterium]
APETGIQCVSGADGPGLKACFVWWGHFHGLKPVAFSVVLLRSWRRTGIQCVSGADGPGLKACFFW